MELRIEAACVAIGGRQVLEDVDADLAPGRITAILGPNGAGKSSLIKAMAGQVGAQGGAGTGGGGRGGGGRAGGGGGCSDVPEFPMSVWVVIMAAG